MLKQTLKKIIPQKTRGFFAKYFTSFFTYLNDREISGVRVHQQQIIAKCRQKEKLKVLFIVTHTSIWKYEQLYFFLKEDPKFEPVIGVVPLVTNQKVDVEHYKQTLDFFGRNGKKTLNAYNQEKEEWIDLKSVFSPDVVFFSNSNNLTFDKYHISHFHDTLTCYVPYAFVVVHSIEIHYDRVFHHLLWKYFVETEQHSLYAELYAKKRLKTNIKVTGFPGLDTIFIPKYKSKNVWKATGLSTYKIIWAPHHTISEQGSGLDYSSFENYYEYFIKLCEEHTNIQVAFKPHPMLKNKLYKNVRWGEEKTNAYYKKWETMPNGQLETGEYIDLFSTSDAMIMDSASFIAEYLYFDKPILFTMRDQEVKQRFNSFGQEIFDYLYTSQNEKEVNHFIENQVIHQSDHLKEKRNQFLKERILPKNGKTASENIYNELQYQLCQN